MRRGPAHDQSLAGYPAARSGLSSNAMASSMLSGGRAAAALAPQANVRASSQPLSTTTPGSASRRALPSEVEQMVAMLDQRVTHATQAEEARLRMLADQTQRLLEGLQAMRVAREIHEERRLKEIRMMENNLQLDLQSARQARKEIETRAEDLASSRIAELGDELRRERLAHESVQEEYTREIGEEVRRLTAILEDQHKTRTEYGDRIVASLEGEFVKVQQAVHDEERRRYEAEGTMLRMVEDMCSGMRGEIQQERNEREAVQGKLLTLLEDTCNRIETSFSPTAPHYAVPFSASSQVVQFKRLACMHLQEIYCPQCFQMRAFAALILSAVLSQETIGQVAVEQHQNQPLVRKEIQLHEDSAHGEEKPQKEVLSKITVSAHGSMNMVRSQPKMLLKRVRGKYYQLASAKYNCDTCVNCPKDQGPIFCGSDADWQQYEVKVKRPDVGLCNEDDPNDAVNDGTRCLNATTSEPICECDFCSNLKERATQNDVVCD